MVFGCAAGLVAAQAADKKLPPAPGKGATLLSPDRPHKPAPATSGGTSKGAPSIPSGATLLMQSPRFQDAPPVTKAKPVAPAPGSVRTAPKTVAPKAEKPKPVAKPAPAPKPVKAAPAPKVTKPAPAPKALPAPKPAKVAKPEKAAPVKEAKPIKQTKPAAKTAVQPAQSPKGASKAVQPAPEIPAPVVRKEPTTKAEKLTDLLDQYKADKITPKQYQERRAKILAEP
jgi:hypothetical protein